MIHIHHVQILVQNGTKYVQKFTRNVSFQLFAERKTAKLKQWVVRSGSIVFLLTESNNTVLREESTEPSEGTSTSGGDIKHRNALHHPQENGSTRDVVFSESLPDQCFLESSQSSSTGTTQHNGHSTQDTVFNVAFEVYDVPGAICKAEENGAEVLCRPTVVRDPISEGHVTIAAIKSCVGNVIHTLVDSSSYEGVFLPGFIAAVMSESEKSNSQHSPCLLTHIDHVTFACPMGASNLILEWYEKCFGMKRFFLMREEDESEGFIVQGENVGLRMKAMEYWHCSETGLCLPQGQGDEKRPRSHRSKFVLAEALPGQGPNQVETFIKQHNGAGIQHIGFHTDDILQAVGSLRDSGLSMIDPPSAYYSQVGKLAEISRIRRDVELLKELGILLDEERCENEEEEASMKIAREEQLGQDAAIQYKYLMQVFTKPIFERDTFFLEIIQRQGATGFGAGNISALWRAVQAYMSYEER
ncbi:4-hydroxyphenylpyruvate dioxygenase-like protein [Asterias rubens]|uniref:4-hydroxyphenylpyruvate dioxygenase-like protein n=1 Tax=Asterias rubens TaxID=7604 RepID=UPI0014551CBF|nr:4-hydroxyphenylpyruvate dioxygenase-like protein [Asterias rubens]XP_033632580.1 4-hydroxyphenylpyruvate dioxygenase-like protein [Asterias rubens]